MSVTLDQLSVAVQSFFTRKLSGAVGDAPGNVLLVLDGFGSPLSPGEFGVGATDSQKQLLAHQRAAQLADQLPAANGLGNGWYLPRAGSRLSFWYSALLSNSVCTSAAEETIAAFETRKASALKRLEQNELLEVAGTTGAGGTVNPTGVSDAHYATGMSPTGWFLPGADSWEKHRIDGTNPVPPAPTPLPVPAFDAQVLVPVPEPPGPDLSPGLVEFFRNVGDAVVEGDLLARQAFLSSEPFGDHTQVDIVSPATGTVLERADGGADLEPGDQIVAIGARRSPAAAAERNAVLMPAVDKPGFIADVREWHKAVGDEVAAGEPLVDVRFLAPITDDEFDFSVPSPVSGTVLAIDRQVGEAVEADLQLAVVGAAPRPPEGFTVEFEYTIVSFGRPWWDEVFLAARNWMVPGFQRGAIASGSVPQVAASAITLITTGMVVVRNLHIASHWDDDERDQLASGALNLGPFSLTGADVDGETLSRPGAQAMGWICQVPPVLPPASDPSLPPA
jgi:2-oxoglutarate dehydrogenase E2 component (dihydrolipoamide succinyltransferase)